MYIVFEGIDGCGKTTQTELVRERLELLFKSNDFLTKPENIITINEPELGDVVNEEDIVELTLRFALQRRVIHRKYDPCFFKSHCRNIVISDRSFYSSLAYQGISSDFQQWIREVNRFIDKPQLVFFFDNGCEDNELKSVYNNYFSVLPFNSVYVNTKKYSITDTTKYITNKILEKWDETINDII